MTRWRTRLAAAVTTLALASLAAFFGPAAQAATCDFSVTYRVVHQGPAAFQAQVIITQHRMGISEWRLAFDFPTAAQQVAGGWGADWDQDGRHVTATSMPWSRELLPDRPVEIGFIGSHGGVNPVPTGFTLNGVRCGGGGAGITEY